MCWSWQPHRCTHFCMQEAEGAEYGYQTDNYPWHILSVWGRCLMQKVIFPPRHHRRSSDFVGVPDTCLCCYSGGTSAPHLTGAGNYLGRTTLLLLFFFFFFSPKRVTWTKGMQRLHGLLHSSQGNTNATRKFFPLWLTTSKNVESQYIEVPAFNAKPVLCIFFSGSDPKPAEVCGSFFHLWWALNSLTEMLSLTSRVLA